MNTKDNVNLKKNTNENSNLHTHHRERMRKRFHDGGISAMEDHHILEFLLFYVYSRKDTNGIAHLLLKEFGSLEKVFAATEDELMAIDGIGERGAMLLSLIGQLVNRVHSKPISPGEYLDTDEKAGEYCMEYFRGLNIEKFILICTNTERKILSVDVISEGDHSATTVDIRKILRLVLKNKATSVIIAHNHPGDSPHPSDSDIAITGRILDVLEGIDVEVIDHIVCGERYYVSMDQRGFMAKPRSR